MHTGRKRCLALAACLAWACCAFAQDPLGTSPSTSGGLGSFQPGGSAPAGGSFQIQGATGFGGALHQSDLGRLFGGARQYDGRLHGGSRLHFDADALHQSDLLNPNNAFRIGSPFYDRGGALLHQGVPRPGSRFSGLGGRPLGPGGSPVVRFGYEDFFTPELGRYRLPASAAPGASPPLGTISPSAVDRLGRFQDPWLENQPQWLQNGGAAAAAPPAEARVLISYRLLAADIKRESKSFLERHGAVRPGQTAATNARAATAVDAESAENARIFAEKGEFDFRARRYKSALYAWRHARLDDPENGVLLLLLAQGYFALADFENSAAVTKEAMRLLPPEKWGVVIANYRELYQLGRDYTAHLRVLEAQVKQHPADPRLRFLAAFHYGFLGYPKLALAQLERLLESAPDDELARRLQARFEEQTATPE
jgi:tetratricopeptide (TPR) repeat protein